MKHNYDLHKTFILIKKFLYKLGIIILFENASLKTAKYGLAKYAKTKTKMAKGKNKIGG